ncbi:MAG: hypothetical protein M0R80_03705 [Proteobacteria bacterium]|jgi:hypothetical protein|nr:hypothetical protein [Pseudomonadota bacterium]
MKEIMERLRKGITVEELYESFKSQTEGVMPGKWQFVGIQFYFVDEERDIMASPGIYSKDFDKEYYENDDDGEE